MTTLRKRTMGKKKARRPKSVLPTEKVSVRLPQLYADALRLFAQQRGLSITEALERCLEAAFKQEAWADTFARELDLLMRLQNGVSSVAMMLPDNGAEDVAIGPFDFEWEELRRLGYSPEVRTYTFGDYHRILTRLKLEREEKTNEHRETKAQSDRNGNLSSSDDGHHNGSGYRWITDSLSQDD